MFAVHKCVRDDKLDPKGAPVGSHRSLGLDCLIFYTIIPSRNSYLVCSF